MKCATSGCIREVRSNAHCPDCHAELLAGSLETKTGGEAHDEEKEVGVYAGP